VQRWRFARLVCRPPGLAFARAPMSQAVIAKVTARRNSVARTSWALPLVASLALSSGYTLACFVEGRATPSEAKKLIVKRVKTYRCKWSSVGPHFEGNGGHAIPISLRKLAIA